MPRNRKWEIDEELAEMDSFQVVAKLASLGMHKSLIIDFLDTTYNTFESTYGMIYNAYKCKLGRKILETQIKVALGELGDKPDTKMLIWLGKQILKQSDKTEAVHKGDEESPVHFVPITRAEPPPTWEERNGERA